MKLKVLENLKEPVYGLTAVGIAFLFFDLNYYFMKYLPGHKDLQCLVGANFTTANIIFSIFYSIMAGILLSNILAVFKKRKEEMKGQGELAVKVFGASGLTGIGMLFGSMTVFCPACSLPVLSLFGFSLGLSASTDFNWQFKVASIALMLLALWLIEKQLKDDCIICKK